MEQNSIKKLIFDEMKRFSGIKWEDVRNNVAKNPDDSTLYHDLQVSRGLNFETFDDPDALIKSVAEESKDLVSSDIIRMEEFDSFYKKYSIKGNVDTFVEIGFRLPRLLKHIIEKYALKAKGYDISLLSVLCGKALGYDCDIYDLNDCSKDLLLGKRSIVVSYHCLEHVKNPSIAINKIFQSMNSNSYFHVEVPIEDREVPNFRYAHLSVFKKGMLQDMINQCGFKILNHNSVNNNDRIFCTKV